MLPLLSVQRTEAQTKEAVLQRCLHHGGGRLQRVIEFFEKHIRKSMRSLLSVQRTEG